VIGIDLGGTNTRAGLVDESGRISKRAQLKRRMRHLQAISSTLSSA
jgi:predicted NBD/HSP70 family sugar kinase